jgi:hypothetical protein
VIADSPLHQAARANAQRAVRELARSMRPRRIRPLVEFAESEVVVPDGPYAGSRWRWERHPAALPLYRAIDSGEYSTIAAPKAPQTGGTFLVVVVPLLWHLFEIGESVVFGVPNRDLVGDKWAEDLLPAIEASRFRNLLPTSGAGSRGGAVDGGAVHFRNGATLRFMTGRASTAGRAGFTARAMFATEVDVFGGRTMDQNARRIEDLKSRTKAYGDAARHYLECTVSHPDGVIWQHHVAGTGSRLATPCPACGEFGTIEREHLVGWRDAPDELAAREGARLLCPAGCGHEWTDDERRTALRSSVLVHRGQRVERDDQGEPRVVGEPPRTRTLALRWNAAESPFTTLGSIAADEYKGARAPDEVEAERALANEVWALPFKREDDEQVEQVSGDQVLRRMSSTPRGVVPEGALAVVAACDVGKYLAHWIALALLEESRTHVIDYGVLDVPSDTMPEVRAIQRAVEQFDDLATTGLCDAEGEVWPAVLRLADANYKPGAVHRAVALRGGSVFTRDDDGRRVLHGIVAARGHGVGQDYASRAYREQPTVGKVTTTGSVIVWTQPGLHVARLGDDAAGAGQLLVEFDADRHKGLVAEQLLAALGAPASQTLPRGEPREHFALSRHLSSERRVSRFAPGKGVQVVHERIRRANHWLDGDSMGMAAARLLGFDPEGAEVEHAGERSTEPASASTAATKRARAQTGRTGRGGPQFTTPDGRAFLASERR